ncbi:MAG TPA: methyltransferase domain-containing protein [Chryseolinea sp.]|nr:methyltransferase domain-containing protein [Chryseolinea sp.]
MLTAQRASSSKDWFGSDDKFDMLYPEPVQLLTQRHWTPLKVSRTAASFLAAERGVKILDIGSGVGKFCLGAAFHSPNAFYYGVEQRKSLVYNAETARQILRLENVSFIHGNFTQLNLNDYDHFYFYNAFYENLSYTDKIDHDIVYSGELFNYYNRYLYNQLHQKPSGTRLATFHSLEDEIPQGYRVVGSEFDNLLKFWIKE